MVGYSDFDFCTTQRIGGTLCLDGNTIIRAYSCFIIYDRVEFVSKLNDRRVVYLITKLLLLLLGVPTECNIYGVITYSKSNDISPG